MERWSCYTFLTIPFETLTSEEAEEAWANQAVQKFLRGVRDMMLSDVFKETMMEIANSRRKNYIQQLYNPKVGTNLPNFLNGAVFHAYRLNKITDLLIQAVSNDIMTHFWKTKNSEKKYKFRTEAQALMKEPLCTRLD